MTEAGEVRCGVCGRERKLGLQWATCGRGLSGAGSIDTTDCYRIGYERLRLALAAAEKERDESRNDCARLLKHDLPAALASRDQMGAALREMAAPKPSVDMADPVEEQLSDALHEISLLRSIARLALASGTPSGPGDRAEREGAGCACGEPEHGDSGSTHSPKYCKQLDLDARSFIEWVIEDTPQAQPPPAPPNSRGGA